MSQSPDRLYELLPVVYRQRDAEQGYPLRELLQVIAEQVDVVEDNISQLYENWFIETCEDWVVPYIGDLIGYRPVHEAGEPGKITTPQGRERNKILIPRREVANTIRYRRRKGTLALLELLANDVAGWPARAVEFYKLLGWTQHLNHQRLKRGRTVDLRDMDALDRLGGPFDELAHTVDVRRINSLKGTGRYNLPNIGVFVWRLKAYPISEIAYPPSQPISGVEAFCLDYQNAHYTFSILGNSIPLFAKPDKELDPTQIATEFNVPTPIRRRAFEKQKAHYYGPDKSLCLFERPGHPIPLERIVAADLHNWHYRPTDNQVAIDSELGRIAFPAGREPTDLRVYYHYGFSADMGGGQYQRRLSQNSLIYSLFRPGHLKNASSLLNQLKEDVATPLARYLRTQFSNELRQQIDDYEPNVAPSERLQILLINELNRLLQASTIYDPERFQGIPISDELQRLINRDPQGIYRTRLNRLLLEVAYHDEIAISYQYYEVVSSGEAAKTINDALLQWQDEQPRHTLIEITDSGVYTEQIGIALQPGQSLEIRAAQHCRPIIRLLNVQANYYDDFTVTGSPGSHFTLDGLLIIGRGLRLINQFSELKLRHCTLVPGWNLLGDCEPTSGNEPSIILANPPPVVEETEEAVSLSNQGLNKGYSPIRLTVEHSIVGTIQDNRGLDQQALVDIALSDSILDATDCNFEALSGNKTIAYANLTTIRSTIIGKVLTHAIPLAENSIFMGFIKVARSQIGCMRFCYVLPCSHTPRRFNCQPDLVESAIAKYLIETATSAGELKPTDTELEAAKQWERDRVRPQFNSTRYGTPTYCQLAKNCAEEIRRGADDESEMGVFHDLYQPQREANLRNRLNEYTPARMEVGIIFAS